MTYTKDSSVKQIDTLIEILGGFPNKEITFQPRIITPPVNNRQPIIIYRARIREPHVIEVYRWKDNKAVWERIHADNINVRVILTHIIGYFEKAVA